jgi:hypothetical protein
MTRPPATAHQRGEVCDCFAYRRKFFWRNAQNPTVEPSKFFAYDFKGKFARFGFCAVSTTIENDRSISSKPQAGTMSPRPKKRPSLLNFGQKPVLLT